MIWFTSDTHYNHKNIVRGTSEWELGLDRTQRVRDFDTLEDHNAKLVENFNKLVKPDDELYHLGDWSFGGISNIWNFRKQLKCKNIHMILGNHDHHIENNKRITITKQEFIDNDYLLAYDVIGSTAYVDIKDLFSSTSHYKSISINGQKIILCHYAMRVWEKSHKGSWMLYGHSHGTLPEDASRRSMDVGVDTNDLKPYSYSEIHDKFKNRSVLLSVDHHSENTN